MDKDVERRDLILGRFVMSLVVPVALLISTAIVFEGDPSPLEQVADVALARGKQRVGLHVPRADGQPIGADYPTSALAKWSIGTPGTIVRLGLCDGTVRSLTLKRKLIHAGEAPTAAPTAGSARTSTAFVRLRGALGGMRDPSSSGEHEQPKQSDPLDRSSDVEG